VLGSAGGGGVTGGGCVVCIYTHTHAHTHTHINTAAEDLRLTGRHVMQPPVNCAWQREYPRNGNNSMEMGTAYFVCGVTSNENGTSLSLSLTVCSSTQQHAVTVNRCRVLLTSKYALKTLNYI